MRSEFDGETSWEMVIYKTEKEVGGYMKIYLRLLVLEGMDFVLWRSSVIFFFKATYSPSRTFGLP
jgi:hypothetical protein